MAHAIKSALTIAFLAAMSATSAADVPTLNVEQTCRDSATADPTIPFDVKLCLDFGKSRAPGTDNQVGFFPELGSAAVHPDGQHGRNGELR